MIGPMPPLRPIALIRTPGTLTTPAQLAEQNQRFLAAATADNTRRTYRSAIRHFQVWGGALPCDEAVVIRYLLSFAQKLNPRTVALRLMALSQWHCYQGFPDLAASATVRKTLRGIERVHGRPQQKAKALLLEDLELIVFHVQARRPQQSFFETCRRGQACSRRSTRLSTSLTSCLEV
ncbi:hypothetical protein [Pseudomonas shahriarae]|nr:hypothetical protein [Pseudomonas shahriarae]